VTACEGRNILKRKRNLDREKMNSRWWWQLLYCNKWFGTLNWGSMKLRFDFDSSSRFWDHIFCCAFLKGKIFQRKKVVSIPPRSKVYTHKYFVLIRIRICRDLVHLDSLSPPSVPFRPLGSQIQKQTKEQSDRTMQGRKIKRVGSLSEAY